MKLKNIKKLSLALAITLCVCSALIYIVWTPIKNWITSRNVFDSINKLCEYEHFSVQIAKGEPSATDMFCGMLTEEVDLNKIIGKSTEVNHKLFEEHTNYAYDIVISSPDMQVVLAIAVHKIVNHQTASFLKEHAFEYNGNLFVSTINDIVFATGTAQIVDLIEYVVQKDTKFNSDIIYSVYFG